MPPDFGVEKGSRKGCVKLIWGLNVQRFIVLWLLEQKRGSALIQGADEGVKDSFYQSMGKTEKERRRYLPYFMEFVLNK